VTGSGNGLFVKILAPVAVMMIASLATNYALINRLDERVKVLERENAARANMVVQVAVLSTITDALKDELADLKLAINPIGDKLDLLNRNIEARRRERER